MELFVDALLDALIDGVKMLPFLYLAYLLIEWLERHHGESIENALAGGGRWGFIPGALLGCVVSHCVFERVFKHCEKFDFVDGRYSHIAVSVKFQFFGEIVDVVN